jgi:flagellar biosynthesis GTPase FlhF
VVVNKTVVTNVAYVNQRVPGAVVATSPAVFTSAQPVARNFVKVDARVVVSAPVVAAAPAVVPSRQAVLGAGAVARVRPPAAIQARAIVAKTVPPPPPPSFDKQQEAIKANAGRPIAVAQMRQIQPPAAQVHAAVRIAPKATPQAVTARGPQPNPNRPSAPNNANRPAPANANNRPANTNANLSPKNNAPVNAHPAAQTNPQLEQQHAEQLQNLRSQQDQERQKLEQQQTQERNNLAQKNATENEQQKLNQQHQQQLENMEKKHDTQEQSLKQKQEQEHKQQQKPANKPPKDEKKPNK